MTELHSQRLHRTFRLVAHCWIASLIFSTFLAETLAIVLGALWLWRRGRAPNARTPWDRPLLLFFLLRLLTIATAVSPAASLVALRKIPFVLVFFPLSAFASQQGPREVIKLLRTFVIAATIASVYGLMQVGMQGFQRLHSTTSGPTTLAMLLAAGFVIGLALLINGILAAKKLWLPGLASMLVAMAFTFCRAPWVASCLVGLGLLWSHARRQVLLLLATISLILAIIPAFRTRYAEVFLWPYAMGDRPVIWQKGWELVQARPWLGYGPASFDLLFDQHHRLKDRGVGAWHNFVLQLWVESGLVSVLALGWILWKTFGRARIALRSSPSPETRAATRALLAGLTTVSLAGLFGGLIGDPISDMLFWGMIGLLAGFAPDPGNERNGDRSGATIA